MGGSGFISSGNESEEEKKEPEEPYGQSGPRVFRPNLTASSPFNSMQAAAPDLDPT